jgi:hypothetical protein
MQPSTLEIRRRTRSGATQIIPAPRRVTTRIGRQTAPWPTYSGHITTKSVNLGQESLKVSLIRSAFSTPRENTRLGTVTDSKVLQMRSSRWPKRLIKRRRLKTQRATSLRLTKRLATSMVDPTPMSKGGSRSSLLGRSWRSHGILENNFYGLEYLHILQAKNEVTDELVKLGSSQAMIPLPMCLYVGTPCAKNHQGIG